MFYTKNRRRDRLFREALSLKSRPLERCDYSHKNSHFCLRKDIQRNYCGQWRVHCIFNVIDKAFPSYVNTEDMFYVASKVYKELLWIYDGAEFEDGTSACPRMFKKRILRAIQDRYGYKTFEDALRARLTGRTNNKNNKHLFEVAIEYGFWRRDDIYSRYKKDMDIRKAKVYTDKEWKLHPFRDIKKNMMFKLFESTGETVRDNGGNTIFKAGSDAMLNQDGIFMIKNITS